MPLPWFPLALRGVDTETPVWKAITFLIVNKEVSDDVVYKITKALYSPEGLAFMKDVHAAASEMSVENPTAGISIPLHEGAVKLWKERGIENRARQSLK